MEYNILTEAGFEDMYREYFPKIYNFIFYSILMREEAEDLVSDIFFKVARKADTFDSSKASFSTWIHRIAQNTLIDYYRRRRITVPLEDEEREVSLTVDFDSQLEMISSEKRRVIFKELSKLKEKERMIIYYKFFEDYNNRQIAELMDMNESTVGTVLSRSLKKMRTEELRGL